MRGLDAKGREWRRGRLAGGPVLTAASAPVPAMASLVKKIISTTKAPALGPYR